MNRLKHFYSLGIPGIKKSYLQAFSKNKDLNLAASNAIKVIEKSPWCLDDTQHHILNFYQKATKNPGSPQILVPSIGSILKRNPKTVLKLKHFVWVSWHKWFFVIPRY